MLVQDQEFWLPGLLVKVEKDLQDRKKREMRLTAASLEAMTTIAEPLLFDFLVLIRMSSTVPNCLKISSNFAAV